MNQRKVTGFAILKSPTDRMQETLTDITALGKRAVLCGVNNSNPNLRGSGIGIHNKNHLPLGYKRTNLLFFHSFSADQLSRNCAFDVRCSTTRPGKQ